MAKPPSPPDLDLRPEHNRIPRELECVETSRPFSACTRCGDDLLDYETEPGYQISKGFRHGECLFEYALCDFCRTDVMTEFTPESKAALAKFQDERVRFDFAMSHCSVCGKARNNTPNTAFVLCGVCEGSHLIHGVMVCQGCRDETAKLIDEPTRKAWQRVMSELTSGDSTNEASEPTDLGPGTVLF